MSAGQYTASYTHINGLMRLFRPFNAIAVIASFLCGYFYVAGEVSEAYVLYGVAALIFAHSATTLQNDIYDAKIDKDNKRKGLLQTGHLSTVHAKRIVFHASVMALAVVALTDKKYDMALWVLGLLFLGWAYNAPPLRLSLRPFASISILGVYYAALPFLFGIFLVGSMHANVAIFMAGLFLQRVATSMLKDYKDVKGDALHGKRTFLLAYGAKATATASLLLYAFGVMCVLGALYTQHGSAEASTRYAMLISVGALMLWSLVLRILLLQQTGMQQRAVMFARCFAQENYVVGLTAVWLILL